MARTEKAERGVASGAVRFEHRTEQACIDAEGGRARERFGGVCGGGGEAEEWAVAQAALGPMHAGRADALGQSGVGGDQQDKATSARRPGQRAGDADAVGRAEMTVYDCRSDWQTFGAGDGVWGAGGVGEEIERRDRRGACIPVEPAGQCR